MPLQRIGQYRILRTIGYGSFSKVKLAEHEPTGKHVAIKIINIQRLREENIEERLEKEIDVLTMCIHPHIIRLLEVIETSTDVYVITELIHGGTLLDYLILRTRLSDGEARKLFQQMICGLDYCHKNRIAHRDLKLENLLLDVHGNVKIADFGFSNFMTDLGFMKTSCGSPNYAAPEVISGKLYDGSEVDIWSCGVILYGLLCGTLPFEEERTSSLFKKIKSGSYHLPASLSEGSRDLISKMLTTNPLRRIKIFQIRDHPWFQKDLPLYLSIPVGHGPIMERIDHDVVEQVVKVTGYPREDILRSLYARNRNERTVTYHLIKGAHAFDTSCLHSYNNVHDYGREHLEVRAAERNISPSVLVEKNLKINDWSERVVVLLDGNGGVVDTPFLELNSAVDRNEWDEWKQTWRQWRWWWSDVLRRIGLS